MDHLAKCTSTNITKKLDELNSIKVNDGFVFDRNQDWLNSYTDVELNESFYERFTMRCIGIKESDYVFDTFVIQEKNYVITVFNFFFIWFKDVHQYCMYQGGATDIIERFANDRQGDGSKYYNEYFLRVLFNDIPTFNSEYKRKFKRDN